MQTYLAIEQVRCSCGAFSKNNRQYYERAHSKFKFNTNNNTGQKNSYDADDDGDDDDDDDNVDYNGTESREFWDKM